MFRAVEKVVNWLRAGYPNGIPDGDYVPLVAVLRRRLTEDEIHLLGRDLVRQGLVPADRIDIGTGFVGITDELPAFSEVGRVSAKLRDAGWDVSDDHWRDNPDSALG